MRSLLGSYGPLALVVASLSLTAGCASSSDASADPSGDVDELNANHLRRVTYVSDDVSPSADMSVHYDPDNRDYPQRVPYIAVELPASAVAPSAAGLRPAGAGDSGEQIRVSGAFPGPPRVLVVDDRFKLLAQATGKDQPDGNKAATLVAPTSAGKRFVLIRDGRWARPMDFRIHVGP